MFRLESVLQLKDEEAVRAMVRKHIVTLIKPLFIAMILIVAPFFFLFPLFSLGIAGVVIFGMLILAGAVWAFRALFLWDADVLILTNMRIIDVDQNGFFSRNVSEAALSAIQDASWSKKGFWQTLFRIGVIKIQTSGATAVLEIQDVGHPERVHELINETRQDAPKINANETPVEKDRRSRIRHIAVLLEKADDSKVIEVETMLEKQARDKSVETLFSQT
ncbi:MAG: PH domain-containing protein [Patescibacteria group bacterium]|nr:PH domain-containing protein [Patescibacteria group bacterium]